MVELLSGEEIMLNLAPVKMLIYKWITCSFYWTKKILVTNKRIIISFSWFGYESFSPAMSCYYNGNDSKTHKKFGDSLIIMYKLGKGRLLGDFIKIIIEGRIMNTNIKIYTNKNHEIEKIIKKNS